MGNNVSSTVESYNGSKHSLRFQSSQSLGSELSFEGENIRETNFRTQTENLLYNKQKALNSPFILSAMNDMNGPEVNRKLSEHMDSSTEAESRPTTNLNDNQENLEHTEELDQNAETDLVINEIDELLMETESLSKPYVRKRGQSCNEISFDRGTNKVRIELHCHLDF